MILSRKNPGHVFFAVALFAPTASVLLFIVAYPMVRAFILSLYQSNLLRPDRVQFIGLGNYIALFSDRLFLQAFRNTLVYNFFTVVLGFFIGFFLAFLLNRNIPFKNFFRGLFLTPWVVPYVVIGFLFLYMFNVRIGIINYTLRTLGVIQNFVNFFTDGRRAMLAVIIASAWNQYPFHLINTLAGLQTIPDDLVEAATIDGASNWNIFWHIKLPWLRTVLAISTTLMMIQNFNNFAIIWSMTEGGPNNSTNIFVTYVFRKAFVEWDFGYASAIGVVWLIILVIFASVYMRFMEKEIY